MTVLVVDDLAVVTGPLTYCYGQQTLPGVLTSGEVVRVLKTEDDQGDVDVRGVNSVHGIYISASSLTPLAEIQDDPEVRWGDLLDPDYVHDYVWDGDYEEGTE